MELLIEFSVVDYFPEMDDAMLEASMVLLNKTMLGDPYLLYEVLAISARRLAMLRPAKSELYMQCAVSLQARSASVFNATTGTTRIDGSNCVPMMLFSSILGRHLIIDLCARKDVDLDTFLRHYLEFVAIHTGIKVMSHEAWPFLLESDMKDFMIWSASIFRSSPVGKQCDILRDLVTDAADLDQPTKDACEVVIRLLQVGFDQMLIKESTANSRYLVIYAWSVAAPPEFTNLLEQRRPEAIVILAYFAVLLHYCRGLWHVGDVGSRLINLAANYLGPAWDHYLSWPLSEIAMDSAKAHP